MTIGIGIGIPYYLRPLGVFEGLASLDFTQPSNSGYYGQVV